MEAISVFAPGSFTSLFATLFASLPLLILLGVLIFVWYKASENMARIAADKGYPERKWFHYCFWLGIAGFLMVCAMPDKSRR